ncbi:hypothetical protein BK744_11070 [Bacillus thuringiensis serovar zhaodongensis]|uniref:DUF1904 family protein n=1 Tax=Bacillus cereus group TaxID=86661 RepID=UPI000A365418|nr:MULTISPECIES: DUF1904 family protein [Bacillus cereus group]OUB76389.1 hypothetical protein BK744_11070 [Bacillus thuringiensis serovar zhaodongensis]GIX59521.1 hypothetical protein BPADB04_45510 [Bacillus paranthracis]
MPHVVFRGITTEQLKSISKPLVEELAEICECGTDNFTLELPSSTFVFNGEEVEAFPLIEVKWFERGQEIRDRFAKVITTYVMDFGLPEVEVVFTVFTESAYYINGKHCAN